MQRKENESFDAYKVRRAAANFAVTQINRLAKSGRGPSARQNLREHQSFSTGIKGMKSSNFTSYGATLKAHFDSTYGRLGAGRNRIH